MRGLTTTLVILGVAAVGAGVGQWHLVRIDIDQRVDRTRAAVDRVRQELTVRSATKTAEMSARGFPNTVDPDWFTDTDPVNALLSDHHPWLEIAGPEEADLEHPVARIAINESDAGLWYNPYRGVVRARVPVTVSDDQALDLYNRINSVTLPDIFWAEPPPRLSTLADASTSADASATSDNSGASDSSSATDKASTSEGSPPPAAKPTRRRAGKQGPLIVVHRGQPQPPAAPQTTDATPTREP